MLKDNKQSTTAPSSRSNAANISTAAKSFPAVKPTTVVQRSGKEKDWEKNLEEKPTTTPARKKKPRKKKKNTTSGEVTTETQPNTNSTTKPGAKLKGEVAPKLFLGDDLKLIMDDCNVFLEKTKERETIVLFI